MSLSFETRVVAGNSNKRLGGYENGVTCCYFVSLLLSTCKGIEVCCRKFAVMLQVTKILFAKFCSLMIILEGSRAACPAYEGIETIQNSLGRYSGDRGSRGLPRL